MIMSDQTYIPRHARQQSLPKQSGGRHRARQSGNAEEPARVSARISRPPAQESRRYAVRSERAAMRVITSRIAATGRVADADEWIYQ
jgi:hypothetical protein